MSHRSVLFWPWHIFFFYSVMEIQFTSHTIYPLKVNNSVIFSIFTALCNHRHNLISEHFHHLKKKPHPNKETACPIPLPASRMVNLLPDCLNLSILHIFTLQFLPLYVSLCSFGVFLPFFLLLHFLLLCPNPIFQDQMLQN